MQVYLSDGSGSLTPLVVLSGLERLLAGAIDFDVERSPQSEQYVKTGSGNNLPHYLAITVRAGATDGMDAAAAVDALATTAGAAQWLYVEHDGDAALVHLAAFQWAGNVQPRGVFSYAVELRWIVDAVERGGPLASDDGAYLLTDDSGTYQILWEEAI